MVHGSYAKSCPLETMSDYILKGTYVFWHSGTGFCSGHCVVPTRHEKAYSDLRYSAECRVFVARCSAPTGDPQQAKGIDGMQLCAVWSVVRTLYTLHCSDRYWYMLNGLGTSVSVAVYGGVEGSNCSVQMT